MKRREGERERGRERERERERERLRFVVPLIYAFIRNQRVNPQSWCIRTAL